MNWIFGGMLLALLHALVYGKRFVPVDKMTDQDMENWVRPPNRQVFQQMLLDRMMQTMDPRTDPCDDFYQYACGNYDAVRPQNFSGKERNFLGELGDLSAKLADQLIFATEKHSASESERKVRDFYRSCMNIKRERHSTVDYVRTFGSWPAFDNNWNPQSFDWMQRTVELMKVGVNTFFNVDLAIRFKDKVYKDTLNIQIMPSGLFFKPISQQDLLNELNTLFSTHLPAAYIEDMSHRMSAFYSRLQLIANSPHIGPEHEEFYIHELRRSAAFHDVARLLDLLVNDDTEPSNTITLIKGFVKAVSTLIEGYDKRTVADTMLYYLFAYAHNEMTTLKSLTNERLQSRCLQVTKELLQPVIAKMFVERYVPTESRQEVVDLMKNLRQLGVEMMTSETEWLDETTRRKAIKKMEGISAHVVYPHSAEVPAAPLADVDIDPTNYMQNVERLKEIIFYNRNDLIGKNYGSQPFDTLEVNPAIANGYRGHIYLQAASLLAPFYSIFAPSFQKYASFVLGMGHEHMHAFDVGLGVKSDEFGNKADLISPARQIVHQIHSECFYTQFGDYTIAGTDVHVKGADTMAENVADNDGIKMSFKLFKRWMAENPDIVWQEEFSFAPLQLNHEQAFFLSYGQLWCDQRSLDELIKQVKTDEHSPGRFRIIGGVSNSHDFARAFNCPVNSKMNPPEKCNYFFE